MYNFVAQLIGYGGLASSVLSFQFNSGKRFFTLQIIMKLCFIVNFFMLGGFGGAALNAIGFINCVICYLKEKEYPFAKGRLWTYVFGVLYAVAGLTVFFTVKNPLELLPTLAAVVTAFMLGSGNVNTIRICQLVAVSPCWLVYNFFVGSHSGVICEIINLASVIIALFRFGGKGMKITARCAAKVNLVLSVPKRYEDGYHEVCTVMQTVGLFDRLTVRRQKEITVLSDKAPCGEDNICYKAAELFKAFGGAHIEIKKSIPLLSGLGGGSSNAAGTLLALNSLYGEPYSLSELEKMALGLGSDVPFFIRGGTQLVSGKGDVLEKLPDYNACLVLIKQGVKKSTGQMYVELDNMGLIDRTADVHSYCLDIAEGEPFNDFERVYDCEDIKSDLIQNGALAACLSGSGPTVFGVFPSMEAAEDCKERLKDKYKEIYACPSVNSGVIFE